MTSPTKNVDYFANAKVGIGIPVYNGEEFLEAALKSVLNQTFQDFEVIVSDNASTDRTEEICRDYASRDIRIKYIRQADNIGAAKNYAACFLPCKHEYFRWNNADDLVEPTLVEKCVEVLDDNRDAVLAYGKTSIINAVGEVTERYDDNLDIRDPNSANRFIQAQTSIGLSNVLYGLMRRELLEKTSLLGNYIASDINLIIELTLYGKFIEIPVPLFYRRMHERATSWDRSDIEVQREFWDPSKKRLQFQSLGVLFPAACGVKLECE
jgi:glycosyltransferase involved in cell wall biosynthesis